MIELEVHGKNIATLQDNGSFKIVDKDAFKVDNVTMDSKENENSNVTMDNDSISILGVDIANIEG